MKKHGNHPQETDGRATELAPMEAMMDRTAYADPSYTDMLQEAINMLPPDGYPRPVVLPAVAVSVKCVPPRSAEGMADYGWDAQLPLSEPERDKDYWIRVLRDTAVPKPR